MSNVRRQKMQRIVELELWSSPRQNTVPYDGKSVAEACSVATAVPREVVLGLNFVPSEVDVLLLARKVEAAETSKSEFEQFCRQRALLSEVGNQESAALFLAFSEGQPLAWLHFPVSGIGKDMALLVHRWAASSGYVIRLGQGEHELSEAGVLALWAN